MSITCQKVYITRLVQTVLWHELKRLSFSAWLWTKTFSENYRFILAFILNLAIKLLFDKIYRRLNNGQL